MANGVMEDERAGRCGNTRTATRDAPKRDAPKREAPKNKVYTEAPVAPHPVLPSNALLTYLDEGAANIVYKLLVPPSRGGPATSCEDAPPGSKDGRDALNFWDGKLLRLRKELPWTAPCALAQADFLRDVYPLFESEHFLEQHLVEVGSSGVIPKLNQELVQWDKVPQGYKGFGREPRPARGHGKYLADDDHGLLVEDMTLLKARDVELIEIKPKWLTQSPSAPKLSKRCRTCAKRARTNAERIRMREPLLHRFCPLDLVSKDDAAVYRAARAILGITDPVSPNDHKRLNRMIQWARTSPVLSRLINLQSTLDPVGVFAADPKDRNFLAAMTLRDCSLYLQIPINDESAPTITKIGDLDLKRPEKAGHWRDVERPLLEEGWYLGTEDEEDKQPLDCNLFPEHWTPRHLKAALRLRRWPDPVAEDDA